MISMEFNFYLGNTETKAMLVESLPDTGIKIKKIPLNQSKPYSVPNFTIRT